MTIQKMVGCDMMMELVFPTIEMKQAALDYRQEHFDRGEKHIHGSAGFNNAETYEDWLKQREEDLTLKDHERLVAATAYFAMVDGEIVGTIQIRHELNDHLRHDGGHIGYGVRPSARRKGYATQMLALALEKCRGLGISKALVTCDKENIASAKTIINNGGVLDSEFINDNGTAAQRYWISI